MKDINNDDLDAPLSEDPEENLRIENELLHLKLNAEFGAQSHSFSNLPPEIENEFLKNVLAFERAAESEEKIKVYDRLGKPAFAPASSLNDDAITTALEEIITLLEEKNIAVDFSGEYDDRTKYTFITEELFEHEMGMFGMGAPGMVTHYSYEEFHPNHALDIKNRAEEFITNWFEQKFGEYSWEIGDPFILPDGQTLAKKEVLQKIQKVFDCYTGFADCKYVIADINFELNENTSLGYAEGGAKYTATLENNEKMVIEGPFKLYLSSEHGWWSIFYFVFPGFEF